MSVRAPIDLRITLGPLNRWTAHRRSAVMVSLVLAAGFAAACDRDSAARGSGLVTAIDTVDGVVRVTNAGTPPEWRLVPVVSIGPKSLEEEGAPEEFGSVSAAALDPAGNVFVADAGNREVRVFGPDGVHKRTFGREGEGPGEFRGLYSLAWVGDRLLTFDPQLGRIGEFSTEGEWLGQRRTTRGVSGSSALVRFYPVGPNEVFRFAIGPEIGSLWVGHHSGGDTGDTVPWPDGPEDLAGAGASIFCQAETEIGFFEAPFAAKFVLHPASGGVVYSAWSFYYQVAVTRAVGDTLRVIARTLPAESLTDEEWAAGSPEYEAFRNRWPNASCRPRTFSRPERKPFIEQIIVAPDGKLWVEVIRTAGNRWEFFDSEGRLLGSVPAPPYKERSVPVFQGEHIVTIRQDELDLDHVDIWRLERVGGGRSMPG